MGNNGPSKSKPESTASPIGRFVKLGSLCVVVALAVVLVVAHFTPPEEPASSASPAQNSGASPLPPPSVKLPVSAIAISNEQLQTEAIQEIATLQARFPNLPESLHVAAMTYAGLRQTEKAEKLWQTCIQLAPNHVGPRVGLANLLIERGEDQRAVEVLDAALADGCRSPELFYRLASAQTKLGQVKEAESTLQTAVQAFPDVSENWLLLGQTKNQLQEYEEGEDCLRKAIDLGNNSTTVYFALANACQRQGKGEQATLYRQRFTELKTEDPLASPDLTFQKIYQQALRPMVASLYASAASVYIKQDDIEEGERLLLRTLDLAPDDTTVLEQLASLYHKNGEIADALAVQRRLVELAPGNVIYLFNLASMASQLNDLQAALQALEKARELRPDFALPYTGLAQVHSQLGNLQQARLFAEGAVRREPSIQGYGVLAAICQELGDEDAAENAREMAKKLATGPR